MRPGGSQHQAVVTYHHEVASIPLGEVNRQSCLAQTGFAAFGKGVQLISGSPYAETTTFPINLAKRLYLPLHDDK